MADTKISAEAAAAALGGTEAIPGVQSGANVKITPAQIKTFANTPGGSDTQVQFNDGGAFGGDAGMVFNKTTNDLTITGSFATTGWVQGATIVAAGGGYFGFTGRAWITAPADGVLLLENDAESGFGRMMLGGESTSYPAISRVGAGLGVVVADASTGTFVEFTEQTAPAAGAANTARLYAEDVTGTTKLRYKDSGGTVTTIDTGGGGSPGGSDTQVQFNDSSAFGGDAGLVYNKTTNVLTNTGGKIVSTGGTVTVSTPVIDATQTWNDGAVAFTGLKSNITSTASSAASLLADLQVAGASKFAVIKDGSIYLNGANPATAMAGVGLTNAAGANLYVGAINGAVYLGSVNVNGADVRIDTAGAKTRAAAQFAWSSDTTSFGTLDTGLARNAAGVVRVSDGTTGYGSVVSKVTLNTQTASYTLVIGDMSKIVEMNVGSANNLTVPLNSSVAYPIGASIDIVQIGAGQTTVVATGGVTINSKSGNLKLTGQYSSATLYKRATDTWMLIGDLSA